MNISLFQNLHELVNSPSNFSISEEDFFFFLIGGYYDEELYDITKIPGYFNECKTKSSIELGSILGRKYTKTIKLHYDGKITLDALIKTKYNPETTSFKTVKKELLNCTNEITRLYENFSISISQKEHIEKVILRLFTLCIIDCLPKLFSSYKNLKMKPKTFNTTIGRDLDAKNLRMVYDQYHKVIISGQYGTGKTHFINYCLFKWNLDDYCILSYEIDLKFTLNKIRYRDTNGYEYSDVSCDSLFNKNYDSSLLIIDNMYFSPNLSKELEYLASMKINIIIITLNDLSSINTGCFYNYQIPSLSTDAICKIFEYDSKLLIENKRQKEMLQKVTSNNVLLVSLIAYQCKKLNTITHKSNLSSIIDQVLDELFTLSKHMKSDLSSNSTFKHPYTESPLNFIGHVKKVYTRIKEISQQMFGNTDYDTTVRQLCCFGWAPIPHKFILSVLPSCNLQKLEELSKLGLITLTKETVQSSPLICRAVFAEGIPLEEYDSLVENITIFLQEYEQTLDIPYLSNIFFTFFSSLYKQIKEKNNPNQKKTALRFENWQELAYLITAYYNQNGDLKLAQNLIDLVKYPDSLENSHNSLDKPLIKFSNKMQMLSESSNMVPSIDNLISDLDAIVSSNESTYITNLYLSSEINMSSIIINSLDTILSQLCILLLELHMNSQNEYLIQSHLLAFERILRIIDSNRLYHSNLCFTEQFHFYFKCYYLITKTDITKNDFEESRTIISKWKNLSYRIRGLAFIIFLESNWAYENKDINLFIDSIIPNINKLKDLIQNCALIPVQTYRLCLYAYIEVAVVQYVFVQHEKIEIASYRDIFNHKTFYDLFNRCNLTKNDLEKIMPRIDHVLSLMEEINLE